MAEAIKKKFKKIHFKIQGSKKQLKLFEDWKTKHYEQWEAYVFESSNQSVSEDGNETDLLKKHHIPSQFHALIEKVSEVRTLKSDATSLSNELANAEVSAFDEVDRTLQPEPIRLKETIIPSDVVEPELTPFQKLQDQRLEIEAARPNKPPLLWEEKSHPADDVGYFEGRQQAIKEGKIQLPFGGKPVKKITTLYTAEDKVADVTIHHNDGLFGKRIKGIFHKKREDVEVEEGVYQKKHVTTKKTKEIHTGDTITTVYDYDQDIDEDGPDSNSSPLSTVTDYSIESVPGVYNKKRVLTAIAETREEIAEDLTTEQMKLLKVMRFLHLSVPAGAMSGNEEVQKDWTDSVEHFLSALKPANILNAIVTLINCTNPSQVLLVVQSLLESYGLLWTSWGVQAKFYFNLLVDRLGSALKTIQEPEGFVNNAASNDKEPLDDEIFGVLDVKVPSHIKPFVKCVGPVLGIVMSLVGVSDEMKYVRRIVHSVADTCKDSKTIAEAVTSMYTMSGKILETLTDDAEDTPKQIIALRVQEMLESMCTLNARLQTEGLEALDEAGERKLRTDFNELEKLTADYARFDGNLSNISPLMRQLVTEYSQVKTEYQRLLMLRKARIEPVVLWLTGDPGTGKSKSVGHIIRLLGKMHGRELTSYSRVKSEYWNGYAQQDVVTYDDFGSDLNFNDVSELINIKSSAPLPVEGAQIQTKNQMFTSRYVIICSNCAGILNYDNSTNPQAVDRRRNLLFKVMDDVAIAYRKQTGNEPPLSHYKRDFSHCQFIRLNPLRDDIQYKVIPGRWNIAGIAKRMYELHLDYKQKFDIEYGGDVEDIGSLDSDDDLFDTEILDEKVRQAYDDAARVVSMRPPEAENCSRKRHTRETAAAPKKKGVVDFAPSWRGPRFVNNSDRKHSYLFIGEAGLGKSKLAADIKQKIGLPVFEEVGQDIDNFKAFTIAVWKAYDGEGKNVIATANDFDLEGYLKKINVDSDAFDRRVIVVRFRLSKFALAAKRGVRAVDFEKQVKYEICRKVNLKVTKQKVTRSELYDFIVKGEQDEVDAGPKIDYDDMKIWREPVPERRIYVKMPFNEARKASFGTIVKAVTIVGFTKIDKLRILKMLPTVMTGITSAQEGDIFAATNSSGYPFEQQPLAVILNDKVFVCYSMDKKLRVAELVVEKGVEFKNKYLSDKFTNACIAKLFDAGLTLLKIVSLGLTSAFALHSALSRKSFYNEAIDRSTIDEELLRNHEGTKDYCPICRSTNCYHCKKFNQSLKICSTYARDPIDKPKIVTNPLTSMNIAQRLQSHAEATPAKRQSEQIHERNFRAPAGATGTIDTSGHVIFVEKDVAVVDKQGSFENNSAFDPGAVQLVPMLVKNTVFVGTPPNVVLRALMVCGRIGVTCAHATPHTPGETFTVWNESGTFTATVVNCNIKNDRTIFSIGKKDQQFRDIRQHLQLKASGQAYDGKTGIMLVVFPADNGVRLATMTHLQLSDSITVDVEGQRRFGVSYTGMRTHAQYSPTISIKGTCGSAIVRLDPTLPRKVIAMHSAADVTTGLGVLLFEDAFSDFTNNALDVLDQLSSEDFTVWKTDNDPDQDIVVLKHQEIRVIDRVNVGGFDVVGLAMNDEGKFNHNFQPLETHYWKSPFNTGEVIFEPTVVSDKDTRLQKEYHPYDDAVANYNRKQYSMDEELLDRVVDDIAEYYADLFMKHNCPMRVCSYLEALNGTSDYHSSNPLARDTSAGYPYKFHQGIHQKSSYLNFDEKLQIWSFADSEHGHKLKNAVDALIAHAANGERTAVVEIATMKDETRKVKRVRTEPKTRAFYGSPVDFTIACRKYFHTWCAAQSDWHEENPIKVGINPLGLGFHKLYRYMSSRSDIGFDMDVAGWDYSVPCSVMKKIWKIFDRPYMRLDPHYDDRQATIRKNLFATLVRPLILYRDTIVQIPGGHISGEPLTAYLNSVVNHVYYYYIWLLVCKRAGKHELCSHQAFWDNVAIAFYGDDAICTVKVAVMDFFNPQVFVDECAKFGVEVTPADKSGVCVFKPLFELEFLKRHFAFSVLPDGSETGYLCGQLLKESFHKMLDWTYNGRTRKAWENEDVVRYNMCAISQVVQVILLEATNHGPTFFYKMRKYLMARSVKCGIPISHWPTYAEYFGLIWDSTEVNPASVIEEATDGNGDVYTSYFQNNSTDMASKGTDPAVVGEKGAPGTVNTNQTSKGSNGTAIQTIAGGTHPSDMYEHTHSPGMLPFELYEKWITIKQFTWESTQTTGSVVADVEVGPAGANDYVKYYCAPYNAWVGGSDYELILAGTGFNGGKLMAVYIPPNIDYTTFTSIQDFEVFPKMLIDVKSAEPIPFQGQDYRNILFHYTSTSPTSVDGTGGTIVIVVYLPLISSGNTAAAVNVALRQKPSKDFRVSTMCPLSVAADVPFNLAKAEGLFGPTATCPLVGTKVSQMIVYSQSGTPVLTTGMYGQVQADGTNYNRGYAPLSMNAFYGVKTSAPPTGQTNQQIYAIGDSTYTSANRPVQVTAVAPGLPNTYGIVNYFAATTDVPPATLPTLSSIASNTPTLIPFDYLSTGDMNWMAAGTFQCMANPQYFHYANMIDPTDTPQQLVNQNESFVQFVTTPPQVGNPNTANIVNTQYVEQIKYLQTGALSSIIQPGQAVLFEMISKSTNQVVNYLKFNFPGYFSAPATTTNVLYNLSQYKFKPIQTMQMTENIPIPTGVSQAVALLGATQSLSAEQMAIVQQIVMQQMTAMQQQDAVDGEEEEVQYDD